MTYSILKKNMSSNPQPTRQVEMQINFGFQLISSVSYGTINTTIGKIAMTKENRNKNGQKK